MIKLKKNIFENTKKSPRELGLLIRGKINFQKM